MSRTAPQVIIVGSGPSSATAAKVLVERGVRVLMLESGSRPPGGLVVRANGQVVYRRFDRRTIERVPVPFRDSRVDWWRSFVPGGLSNHWTASVPRFAPEDFVEGAAIDPALAWPVTYAELEPFYESSEELLTVTAGGRDLEQLPLSSAAYRRKLAADWEPVADAAAHLGHGFTVMPMAVGHPWMVARRSTEFNSYWSVVHRLRQCPNFELRSGAHVVEVLPTDARRGGPGVRYCVSGSEQVEEVRAAAVVLGAGTVGTTRLLLASRSLDAPHGIGNGRDVLGRFVHDHLKTWWPCRLTRRLSLPAHPYYMTRRRYGDAEPLTGRSWTIGLRRSSHRLSSHLGLRGRELGVQVFGTVRPRYERRIRLVDDADVFGDPSVGIELRYDDEERAQTFDAGATLRRVFDRAGIGMEISGPVELGRPGESVHLAGSVRMHDDPRYGVLDRWNRVHEMPEIVVCDMSAFTTSPEKNPTLTAMALAARAADRLADELRCEAGVRSLAS